MSPHTTPWTWVYRAKSTSKSKISRGGAEQGDFDEALVKINGAQVKISSDHIEAAHFHIGTTQ